MTSNVSGHRMIAYSTDSVRVFTHMVSCHHEEALNYKFNHKRANKSLRDTDRVDHWFNHSTHKIAIKMDCGVVIHKGPNVFSHYTGPV